MLRTSSYQQPTLGKMASVFRKVRSIHDTPDSRISHINEIQELCQGGLAGNMAQEASNTCKTTVANLLHSGYHWRYSRRPPQMLWNLTDILETDDIDDNASGVTYQELVCAFVNYTRLNKSVQRPSASFAPCPQDVEQLMKLQDMLLISLAMLCLMFSFLDDGLLPDFIAEYSMRFCAVSDMMMACVLGPMSARSLASGIRDQLSKPIHKQRCLVPTATRLISHFGWVATHISRACTALSDFFTDEERRGIVRVARTLGRISRDIRRSPTTADTDGSLRNGESVTVGFHRDYMNVAEEAVECLVYSLFVRITNEIAQERMYTDNKYIECAPQSQDVTTIGEIDTSCLDPNYTALRYTDSNTHTYQDITPWGAYLVERVQENEDSRYHLLTCNYPHE
jgi:hypothetical protein